MRFWWLSFEKGDNYLDKHRPLTQELPVIRAEGRTLHVGRQTAVAEGKIIGVDGKVYAHATTTCLIFDI